MPRGKFLIPPNHEDLGQYSSQLQANRAAFGLLPDLVIKLKVYTWFFIITVKDHKECSDEYRGPPVRPVCGAVVGLQLQAFTRDERDTG